MKNTICFLLWFFLVLAVVSIGTADELKLSGFTMGTTYHIVIAADNADAAPRDLKEQIDHHLALVNDSMSTFKQDSEISKFNQFDKINSPFRISVNFLTVMKNAANIYKLSDGAWDGTVKPVIDLWGFGNGKLTDEPPTEEAIRECLKITGFNRIKIDETGFLTKTNPRVTLDLASIAKGYGVDYIAGILKKNNLHHFIVEIGGEVFCSGKKMDNSKWKVGVNTPDVNASYNQVYAVLHLTDKALATSGDYRNYFKKDGKLYSHVIDPKTGHPVDNGVVSASIASDSCVFSDGLATAVMVMGHEKGLELVNRLENTECLIIVKNKNGTLSNYYSTGFKALEIP